MLNVITYVVINVLLCYSPAAQVKAYHLNGQAQGTTWQITYYSDGEIIQKTSIDSILATIDTSLSLYNSSSLIVKFNNSKRGIKADKYLIDVVKRSLQITEETEGISDITVGPLVSAWGFGANKTSGVPDSTSVAALLSCVGSHNIQLKGDSLIKNKPCVAIDVNGIAQGYSVDILANYLELKRVRNFLVELGGELRIKGNKQPAGEAFRIGIESPANDDLSLEPMQKIVQLRDGAITTSGNYRRFKESGGKRYTHIIDPRTGRPAETEVISVTVFAKDAITADAFDNALMLMNVKNALAFIESRKDLAAFIIYRTSDGSVADTASTRFAALINQKNQPNNLN